MKAMVLRGTWDLSVEEIERPLPSRGQVLVRTAGAGACSSEVHQIKAARPGAGVGKLPKVLGHEASGTILAVGDNVPEHRIGEHVIVPFITVCGACSQCLRGRSDLCHSFWKYNRGQGTWFDGRSPLRDRTGAPIWVDGPSASAEYFVVPAATAFTVPRHLGDLPALAIVGCALLTAYGAINNAAKLSRNESVVIIGAGGVGTQMIGVAKALGARPIVAIDIDEAKLAAALDAGADHALHAFDEHTPDTVNTITDGGADIVLEANGHSRSIQQALQLVRRSGRVVLVGVHASGGNTDIATNDIVRRQISVIGNYGARPLTDMPAIIQLIEQGLLNPAAAVSRRGSIEEAPTIYRALSEGRIIGRAIIEFAETGH